MTDKQVAYATRLQAELNRLNPTLEENIKLASRAINHDTPPFIIDQLLNAITYEENMIDSAFEGQFLQE